MANNYLDKLAESDPQKRIFEQVKQLNYGQHLITEPQQKIHLAKLNCRRKSQKCHGLSSSGNLFRGGNAITRQSWDFEYILTKNIYTLATEVAYLNGDFADMEILARLMLRHGKNWIKFPFMKLSLLPILCKKNNF
ncbi:hypothetical protein [Planktothricoides raciborskii]|uniref:Uncharacterized protein n=1 Tax=Planktothricoides raciborskii GIHE-MW2 TaxID=2792601 RepID=A0AAU8J792_9CYAN